MAVLLREVIGDVIRDARTSQGRTLREVSDTARVSLGYLSEVERGRKEASSELLASICDALDVELSDLLDSVSRTMRTDAPADMDKSGVITNSTKPGIGDSNRPRTGGLDLGRTLRIVLPYGSSRPGAPVA